MDALAELPNLTWSGAGAGRRTHASRLDVSCNRIASLELLGAHARLATLCCEGNGLATLDGVQMLPALGACMPAAGLPESRRVAVCW